MPTKYYLHHKCNICGSGRNTQLHKLGRQNLVRCLNCGLQYLNKQRTDFENLYNEDYFFKSESNNANYFSYDDQESKILKANFSFAYDYINKNYSSKEKYRLLDIGAGFGYFIKNLNNKHCETVEISKIGARKIRANGIKVYEGNFLDIKIAKKFDIITSFDVIEHQIFLDKYLKKINSLLKNGGVFIFTTPDYNTILTKIFGKRSPTIQPLYHNYYFNKNWLKNKLPSFGLELIDIKTTYFTKATLGHILLMCSFALPFIKKLPFLFKINNIKIFKKPITFIRFGGIEAIFRKV